MVNISIDRGGTFTDIYAKYNDGKEKILKILSTTKPDPIIEGVKLINPDNEPVNSIRIGTTIATNALLQRKGTLFLLCVTKGFKDLLYIGNQSRPNIFQLNIPEPSLLHKDENCIEVSERINAQGRVLEPVNAKNLELELLKFPFKEIPVAICFMHSYINPAHELHVSDILRESGFRNIICSHQVLSLSKYYSRMATTSLEAYLSLVMKEFSCSIPWKNALIMQSNGGLVPKDKVSGAKSIFSGPAGGVVSLSKILPELSGKPIIGFDMGGTSTDVCRYESNLDSMDGKYQFVLESSFMGIPILTPAMKIESIAAGGGSILSFSNGFFRVGPDSVGATPGPICYDLGGDQLSLTDANLLLGRIEPFSQFPLNRDKVRRAFTSLTEQINQYRHLKMKNDRIMTIESVAQAFVTVANESMAKPIRLITEAKGYQIDMHMIVAFGGAAGQHICFIASLLGIREIYQSRYCSIQSAYGIYHADEIEEQVIHINQEYDSNDWDWKKYLFEENDKITIDLAIRNKGSDHCLMIRMNNQTDITRDYKIEFKREFGFLPSNSKLVIDHLIKRKICNKREYFPPSPLIKELFKRIIKPFPKENYTRNVYLNDSWQKLDVYDCDKNFDFKGGMIKGPAIIKSLNTCILLETHWTAHIDPTGNILMEYSNEIENIDSDSEKCKKIEREEIISFTPSSLDLTLYGLRFQGIAEQMGTVLQHASRSVNIKERLDFSCAIFDKNGDLIANAPHIPVHLGAMQYAIKWQLNNKVIILPGDVILTNHPVAGGSHLPDITLIMGVYHDDYQKEKESMEELKDGERNNVELLFFVAARGHHADIGGITPGSMPSTSRTLEEEGIAIYSLKIVEKDQFKMNLVMDTFEQVCNLSDTIADLQAQVAALRRGSQLLQNLMTMALVDNDQKRFQKSLSRVDKITQIVQGVSNRANDIIVNLLSSLFTSKEENDEEGNIVQSGKFAKEIEAIDYMDDGSILKLKIYPSYMDSTLISSSSSSAFHKSNLVFNFDFTGTSPQVIGNWNIPKAVTFSALIYCLRCLINDEIPLNSGCIKSINLIIPPGSLLDPDPNSAIVSGNVLTSQRIVDLIFKALKTCAASHGCCNNFTFGYSKLINNSNIDSHLPFGYYETIGGGSGAGPHWHGRHAIQTHMTNTRITDPEILEQRYPVLQKEFSIRRTSGGRGKYRGGDGIKREIQFLHPGIEISLLTERRVYEPYGMRGGESGKRGINLLLRHKSDNSTIQYDHHGPIDPPLGIDEIDRNHWQVINLGSKCTMKLQQNDIILIITAGGGGYEAYEQEDEKK